MTYPVRALAVLSRTPSLWSYVAIPIGVNVVVGAILYLGLLLLGLRGIDRLLADRPDWLAVVDVLLRVLLVLGLLVLIGFVMVRFGIVLGSPWYARLSERLEQLHTGRALPGGRGGLTGVPREIGHALTFEAKKLLLVLGIGLPLLLLNLIPVAGSALATVGGIALGATIACLDFLEPPLDRRGYGFRGELGVIGRGLPATAGFGLVCFALVSIPLLNLLTIPLCVAAGTLFFSDRLERSSPSLGR
jgi:CysZ protein